MFKRTLRRGYAFVNVVMDSLYDARRFFRASSSGKYDLTDSELEARILAKAHSLEKGLSLPAVRAWFGIDALRELERCLKLHEARHLDVSAAPYRMAAAAVRNYLAYQKQHHGEAPDGLKFVEAMAMRLQAGTDNPSTIDRTAHEVRALAQGSFPDVVASRHSIRMFADTAIDMERVNAAIELAMRSPSVCNRQGARVHLITEPQKLKVALDIQGGNRGFGEQIRLLLVVACDMSIFRGSKERNQGFVDGGLFAMTLLYGLHYQGLGACTLNWSAGRRKDLALRRQLDLPESHLVCTLIGVGNLRDDFRVAASPRRSLEEVVIRH